MPAIRHPRQGHTIIVNKRVTRRNGSADRSQPPAGKLPAGPGSTAARSKEALRDELEQATQRFLRDGGEVRRVPPGTSAWEPGTRPAPAKPLFSEPRDARTPVSDVVARIEARREAMKKRTRKPAPKTRRPKRRVIYDDFGEPLRRIWVDD